MKEKLRERVEAREPVGGDPEMFHICKTHADRMEKFPCPCDVETADCVGYCGTDLSEHELVDGCDPPPGHVWCVVCREWDSGPPPLDGEDPLWEDS